MCRMNRRRGILLSTYPSFAAGGARLKQDGQDYQDGQDKERPQPRLV